jgi:glycosyltransferase involved in cell wall biosynthesis
LRVLHGMTEVAGQNYYSVKGLREIGVYARSAVWRKHPFGYPVNYNIGIGDKKLLYPWYLIKMICFFVYALFSFDCFHFHFTRSLLPFNYDLYFLKIFRKKVFFEFHGSEVRGVLRNITYPYYETYKASNLQRRLLKRISKYADGFILHDIELVSHLPDCEVPIHIVPLRVDIEQYKPIYPAKEKEVPIILHAPSSRSTKGTGYLIEALEKVDAPFEFVLVEGMSQVAAFEQYGRADIVFDQISVGTYGVFAIEAMALGKPVLVYVSEMMKDSFPDSLPVVNVKPDDLVEIIEALLLDGEKRHELGVRGRKYVEEYHDYRKNAKLLKDIYEGKQRCA